MFTPPPSPLPTPRQTVADEQESYFTRKQEVEMDRVHSIQEAKKSTGRRFRWAVILLPVIVICITASITYWKSSSAPSSKMPISWHGLNEGELWVHHRRQPGPAANAPSGSLSADPDAVPSSASSATASASSSADAEPSTVPISQQPLPTVPSSPPVLPTPFPQPFDSSIAQNFSSATCQTFFTNMTNSSPFRQCRPFSLLLQSSSQFVNAQTDLKLMNSLVWGTCNTNVPFEQCQANMGWFSTNMKTACATELKNNYALVTSTQIGLQSFSVLHDAACQVDPTTNSYCYLKAVANTNPVDVYYFGIPLGIPLPAQSLTLTCSTCAKTLMHNYATALKDPAQAPLLDAMQKAYTTSVTLTAGTCGSSFASSLTSAAAALTRPSWALLAGVVTFAWTLSWNNS
ncbi:hypothetical protein D9619_008071 [Psilocybe cf. subviscida]|uniref:DUF7729 domain-containing protein n=1 Tax=Psilocybe cf. subviscida TaxID=2480587 RepID=A0A8H5AUH0_9AGAR|nr:hypothetical protein D9619_008071 [Psilocybe cf. subviscida]